MRAALALALLAACGGDDGLAQHEVTAPGDLLTDDGRLREPGWSRRQVQRWNEDAVADPSMLRRWDFFMIVGDDAAVSLTLSDLGFLQFATVGVVDRTTREAFGGGALEMDRSRLALTSGVLGDASFTPAGLTAPAMTFSTTDDGDEVVTTVAFDLGESLFGPATRGAFTIRRRAALPYLSLATPFAGDPHQFFFEQKVHGMTADGSVTVGDHTWSFTGASAVMDWGRGQWPAQVTWRWAGAADGPLAFNLGDGFGDDRAGTENLVVYEDVAHKVGRVAWTYDAADPLADWRFESTDGRVSLVLHPDAPEVNDLDLGERFSHLRKAYGRFAGTVTLDDGRVIAVDAPGFAEQMDLSW